MMRKFSFGVGVLLMCLLLVLSPSVALGEDRELEGGVGVGWAGEVEGGNYAVHARALNKYNAACWAMGVNPLTISTVKRSKLSDPNYGGDFYVYAQSFTNIIGWDDVPGWMPTYATLTFVMYGFDNQWASEVSKSLYDSAKADFKRVLAGEDVGGGGGSGGSSSGIPNGYYYYFDIEPNFNDFPADVPFTKIYFEKEHWDTVMSNRPSSQYIPYVLMYKRNINDSTVYGYEFFTYLSATSSTVSLKNARYNSNKTIVTQNGAIYEYGDGLPVWMTEVSSANLTNLTVYAAYPLYVSDATVVYIGEPGGDWPEPDTPVVPTAPQIPTPTAPIVVTDPTVTEPTVIWPDIDITVNPPEVNVEVTPSGLDYTELLTRINDNLESIDSYTVAINSNLNSLRSDLVSGFDDVVSSIRNVYQYLQHLDSVLEVHCKHIRDSIDQNVYELELYLKQLFEWLPKQLDFDANFDYDDSAVTTLLRSILNKIPGSNGNPNTFMPNPQSDEPGFFDWLLDLWHRFLIDLVSVLPDELGSLVDAFSQLTHYFPFSIPWDLFALLLLFEHEPVTPVFSVPWGYGGAEGQVEMITVDLSEWDGVMAMVRPVFLVGFCFKLALITKDLLSNFDLNKGGV